MEEYRTPEAFRQALKARVKRRARESGRGFNRMLQIVLFERFLARVYDALGEAVVVKGGFAMELRLKRARTTKDVDLRVEGDLDELLDKLREESARQRDDYLTYEIGDEADFKEMLGDQLVYGGRRLRVQAMLAGQPFGGPFRLDVSLADEMGVPPEQVRGTDLFEFVGIEPLDHWVYPKEIHVAEKLHALTLDYESGPSSRAKDLIDIGLLAGHYRFQARSLRESLESTFEFRDTHELPAAVPEPPDFWGELYRDMRFEDELVWDDVDELGQFARRFLNPVLEMSIADEHEWEPTAGTWST